MPSLKRFFLQSVMTLGMFFALGIVSASAASVYNVVETTATVGSNAALEIEYTVDLGTGAGQQTWANADTLTLTLPANFPDWSALTFIAEHDDDATNNGVTEDAITAGGGNGQYAIAGKVITVKWDLTGWGATVDDAETIRFLITAGNVPTYANATSTFTFAGTTAAADTNPSGTDTVNVSADALTATNVDSYVFTQNLLTTSIISLTTTVQIPSGGRIAVTYPSGYDISASNAHTAQRLSGMDGTWTVTVSGQVMTLTQTGGSATSAATLSFEVADVRNPVATTTTGTYTITTKDTSGNDLETDVAIPGDAILEASEEVDAVLAIPTNLVVSDAEDGNGVVLTWTDPDDNDSTAVQILRGISPIPVDGQAIQEVPIGVQTYTDTGVETGDVVTYQLRATDSTDMGDLTEEVTFTVGSGTTADTTEDETTDDTTDEEDTTDEDEEEEVITLTDIDEHWAAVEIEVMVASGVVEGNPDGTFNPDGNLNRAEAAALLWRVLGAGGPGETVEDPFSDVDMNEWYAAYIARLKNLELVEGNPDGTYEPSEEINRAEFLQLAMNVYEYLNGVITVEPEEITDLYSDLDTAEWYATVVTLATEQGFISGSECEGDRCFYAASGITRAEATVILYRMFVSMEKRVNMTAVSFEFEPEVITVSAGQEVTIIFPHVEGMHTFAIDELSLDGGIEEDGSITFTAPTESGDYSFYCSMEGHHALGMEGILRVE